MKRLILLCFCLCLFSACQKPSSGASLEVEITLPPRPVPTLFGVSTVSPLTPAPSPTPIPLPTPEPSPSPEAERFEVYPGFSYQALDTKLKERITGMSFPAAHEDCRIEYEDLAYLRLLHVNFEGEELEGELIVHESLAAEVLEIFHQLYLARYPIHSLRLVDDYGEPGDDNRSMAANNSSAFNYRRVTGSRTLSRHSYGAAIDINPLFNPYLDGDRVAPPAAEAYVDRSQNLPGMIDHEDLCYRLFLEAGWTWGGDWKGDKDYQHFSKDIGF